MQAKLELLDHDTLVVSPTQLSTIKTCPRMWLYNYLYRRVRAGAFAARDGGKAFDDALNRRYRQASRGPVTPDLEAAMQADIDAGFAGLDLPLDEYRTAARYKEVVTAYNEYYRDEPFEVLGVQVPFTVELGDVATCVAFWETYASALEPSARELAMTKLRAYDLPPRVRVLLHGILDLLVRHRDTGMTLVVDTKTSNSWDARRQSEYDNHAQMKAYAWAMPRLKAQGEALGLNDAALARLPEVVHGCMVNAVVIRPPYARESSANRANAKPRNEFHRYIVAYSQERLDEWREDALAYVETILGCYARNHFPQNEKHCAFHYGARCGYADVCFSPRNQRETILGSDLYQDYQRGPLAAAKEGEPR